MVRITDLGSGSSYDYGSQVGRFRGSNRMRVGNFKAGAVGRTAGRAFTLSALVEALRESSRALGGEAMHSDVDTLLSDFARPWKWKEAGQKLKASPGADKGSFIDDVRQTINKIGDLEHDALNWIGSKAKSGWNALTGGSSGDVKMIDAPNPYKRVKTGPGPVVVPINKKDPMLSLRKRKYKYFTTGHGGSLFRGKKKYRAAKAAYTGCVIKGEQQGTVTDATAVYVGHTSFPLIPSLRAMGWAIVRLLAKKWHQDIRSFEGAINGPDTTSACSIRVTLTVRTTFSGICDDHTWTDTSSTWAELGDNIMHHIVSNCSTSATYYEVVRIKFANITQSISAGAGSEAHTIPESLQTVVLDGHALKITLSGFSKMRIQNNTVSTSGDTSANEQSDDIANNPLVGKQYFTKGAYHQYKFNDDYSTSVPMIVYSESTGYMKYSPTTATSISTAMQGILLQVPNPKFFTNMNGYRNVKLMPGEIKSTVCKSKYTFSLNKWIKVLFNVFRTSTSLNSAASGNCNFHGCGRGNIIGLEHMLHSGTEPDISVSYQMEFTVTGIAKHKSKHYCAPSKDLAVNSKIVEEEPEVA